jgi:hypothetical protein
MCKTTRLAMRTLVLIVGILAFPSLALAQAGVKVGNLTCNVSSGWGFVFGSSKNVSCTFAGPNGYEYYAGTISKFGVDIGYTRGGILVWTVFAPTALLAAGSLSGSYVGGTASATVGVGIGANALIGGSANSVGLQPLSIEGSRGLNVSGGIGAMTLVWSAPAPIGRHGR